MKAPPPPWNPKTVLAPCPAQTSCSSTPTSPLSLAPHHRPSQTSRATLVFPVPLNALTDWHVLESGDGEPYQAARRPHRAGPPGVAHYLDCGARGGRTRAQLSSFRRDVHHGDALAGRRRLSCDGQRAGHRRRCPPGPCRDGLLLRRGTRGESALAQQPLERYGDRNAARQGQGASPIQEGFPGRRSGVVRILPRRQLARFDHLAVAPDGAATYGDLNHDPWSKYNLHCPPSK